jgi:hypothetical protein
MPHDPINSRVLIIHFGDVVSLAEDKRAMTLRSQDEQDADATGITAGAAENKEGALGEMDQIRGKGKGRPLIQALMLAPQLFVVAVRTIKEWHAPMQLI